MPKRVKKHKHVPIKVTNHKDQNDTAICSICRRAIVKSTAKGGKDSWHFDKWVDYYKGEQ